MPEMVCNHCRNGLAVSPELVGQEVKCPHCGRVGYPDDSAVASTNDDPASTSTTMAISTWFVLAAIALFAGGVVALDRAPFVAPSLFAASFWCFLFLLLSWPIYCMADDVREIRNLLVKNAERKGVESKKPSTNREV